MVINHFTKSWDDPTSIGGGPPGASNSAFFPTFSDWGSEARGLESAEGITFTKRDK